MRKNTKAEPTKVEKKPNPTRERMGQLIQCMQQRYTGREELIWHYLLSVLSGNHLYVHGMWGLGQRPLVRQLTKVVKEPITFLHLRPQYVSSDQLRSLLLKPQPQEESAKPALDIEIVYVEEPWQMEVEKQYILLQAMEAQEDATDGYSPHRIFFLASTENVPQTDMAYHIMDYVLFRDTIQPIQDDTTFAKYIACDNEYEVVIPEATKFSIEEILNTRKAAQRITIPQDLISCITLMRARLNNQRTKDDRLNPADYLSDSRWRRIVRLLQTVALLHGRSAVDCSDLMLLSNLLWNQENQQNSAYLTVSDAIVGDYSAAIESYEKQLNSLRLRIKDDPIAPDFVVLSKHFYRLLVSKNDNFFSQEKPPIICGPDFDKLSIDDTADAFIYKHPKTILNIIRTKSGYSEEGHTTPPEGAQMLKLGKSFLTATIDERNYAYVSTNFRFANRALHPQLYAERDQLAMACKDLQKGIQNRLSHFDTQNSNLFLTNEQHKLLSDRFSKLDASIKALIDETTKSLA